MFLKTFFFPSHTYLLCNALWWEVWNCIEWKRETHTLVMFGIDSEKMGVYYVVLEIDCVYHDCQ